MKNENKSEFINYVWIVPRNEWTGLLETAVRSPINFFSAWEEMAGNSIGLETSLRRYPLVHESKNNSYVLIAQTEWRGMHRLSVLTDKSYKVINKKSGTVEWAGIITWIEIKESNFNSVEECIKV